MSRVFADSSAFLAIQEPTDHAHAKAVSAFGRLRAREVVLITSSYVLSETYALLLRRYGLQQALKFRADVEPLLQVIWVERSLHERGLDLLATRRKPRLSLVDAVSFVLMRDEGIDEAFAFDPDFDAEGFRPA